MKLYNSATMHGFLIIDKPLNISSAQVVGKIKRLMGRENKIGHAGTLDPLATGVLPIAINEATKVVQFLTDADKEYEFEITWGEERDTDDAEGKVTRISDLRFKIDDLLQAMEKFKGEIEQIPPQYSAIKLQGKKAYKLAREGKEADIKPRRVKIYELNLKSEIINHKSAFQMKCSKGTYVRSIARDMGRILGCYGYVSALKRTRHGQFGLMHAITLEKFGEICEKDAVSAALLPLEEVLDGIPALSLEADEEAKVRNGVAIFNRNNLNGKLVRLMRGKKLVALAAPSENSRLQPVRVFNH